MGKRLLLILNPISGMMTGKKHLADVIGKFCGADYEPTVFVTGAAGDATRYAARWGGQVDLVVAMGGDGTFTEVVTGLLQGGHHPHIGYIPCGSTNDFAAAIGLKKTIPAATDAILNGIPHTYDVGLFGERPFSYVASCGVFTRASYATPQNVKNALGYLAYVMEGIKDLATIHPHHLSIEVDGKKVEGDYLFAAVSNSTSLGGVLKLNKDMVDMNDGMLELLLVSMPRTAADWNESFLSLAEQRYDTPNLTLLSGREFHVTAPADMEWSLDGEWCGGAEHITIRNCPNAICLIH